MMKMLYRILLLSWCMLMSALALPIESKPLNNNPESWNLSWLVFTPRNSSDPSAEALVSSDPHVKKSKITPKSIFIAPSAYSNHDRVCPHGYRIDDNGKCIKTVTINQDDILAARLTDLFGIDENSDKNGNSDSDYDYDEDKNENSGPLQINLPLAIDIQEETSNGKKVEYIIEEKIVNMRNLDPKNAKPKVEEIKKIVSAPVSEKLISNDLLVTPEITTTTEIPLDDLTTTTQKVYELSTDKPIISDAEVTTTIMNESATDSENTVMTQSSTKQTLPTTEKPTTLSSITTTSERIPISTTTEKTKIVPTKPELFKINSVDFMPKITQRKTNRNRGKNSRTRKPKPIIQQQPSQSTENQVILKSHSIDQLPIPKKNRTRNGMKRRKLSTMKTSTSTSTTTTTTTEIPVPTHNKPHYWLPKGWTIDETTKEKPVLIRFWSEQPIPHEERARSHNSRHQRVNSRMPTESMFKEITAPELEGILKEN
ncbi:hypothetical protein ACKWTF_002122 [Chironomus riparius]